MTGFELMSTEQQAEWVDLAERAEHRDTLKLTPLDAEHLAEYEALAERLEHEHRKAISA